MASLKMEMKNIYSFIGCELKHYSVLFCESNLWVPNLNCYQNVVINILQKA